MNKKLLSIELAVILGVSGMNVQALNLQTGDLLAINTGSWFAVDFNGDQLIQTTDQVAITQGTDLGIIIGAIQPTANLIDLWSVISLPGYHYTTIPVTGGTSTGLNFSGWSTFWNGAPVNNAASYGAWAPSNCATLGCNGVNFTPGIATFIWSGVYGTAYQLWFSWGSLGGPVAQAYPQEVDSVSWPASVLYLEGTVQAAPAVPVPAAAWLFGSGLLGLMGVARRKAA